MKLVTVGLSFLVVLTGIKAQTKKLVAGAKLQIIQESKLTNTSNMMGSDIEAKINSTVYLTIEIKSVSDTGIVLTSTINRVKGSASAMGQESNFDSNDPSTTSNPMLADELKNVNKPEDFTIANGKIVGGNGTSSVASITSSMETSSASIVEQLFLSSEAKNKSEGYKWTSDEKSDDGTQKQSSIFTITKSSNDQTEVTTNTTLSANGKSKMMNMDVTQHLDGSRTSTSTYQNSTSLLNTSTQNLSMSGTEEVMGQNIPISLKGVITMTVQ